VNVLKSHLRAMIYTLLRNGVSQREIRRETGIDRKTVRRYQREWEASNSSGVATGSGIPSKRDTQRGALGLCAPPGMDPGPGTSGAKCSEHLSGSGGNVCFFAQVQFGEAFCPGAQIPGARAIRRAGGFSGGGGPGRLRAGGPHTPSGDGQYKKPYLFVMTLKYSRKSFRKVVWNTNQQVWARLHKEVFFYFGGACRYVLLDNLREGVIKPDLYEPDSTRSMRLFWPITPWRQIDLGLVGASVASA